MPAPVVEVVSLIVGIRSKTAQPARPDSAAANRIVLRMEARSAGDWVRVSLGRIGPQPGSRTRTQTFGRTSKLAALMNALLPTCAVAGTHARVTPRRPSRR